MNYKFKDGDAGLTSHGYPYRVIETGAKGDFPVVALISYVDDMERPIAFTASGEGPMVNIYGLGPGFKLLPPEPVKIKRTMWINVYPPNTGPRGGCWSTFEDAKRYRVENCIATVPVTFEFYEGEGLED
jgi:hypothetical protein